jgi:peptidoglycan-associated lipoprotein
MPRKSLRTTAIAIAVATIALSGCASYIKRDEFDSTIADLRATDQRLQSQIEELSRKHDALVTEMQGRIRVETGAHFATGDATLSEEDKPLLDDFARAMKSNHSDAVVTVEGFADPAGSTAFNQRLGKRRAETVRDYLVGTGGLGDGQVRAVSYGEATNRLVRPGATGDAGRDNRRVSLVVDYAGMGGMQQPMQPEQTPPEQTPQPEQPQTSSGT